MDIWVGPLHLHDNSIINDIHLFSSNASQSFEIPTQAKLEFLSIVHPSTVPLCLASGSSCNVWTRDAQTEAWFSQLCIVESDIECDQHGGDVIFLKQKPRQSCTGILARVSAPAPDSAHVTEITELLFYGVLGSLESVEDVPLLRVHALPLSSHRLNHIPANLTPPHSPSELTEAQFFPLTNSGGSLPSNSLSNVFEEARQLSRKVKGKGGQGVAAAAAAAAAAGVGVGIPKVTLLQGQKKRKDWHAFGEKPQRSSIDRSLTRTSSLPFDFPPTDHKVAVDLSSKRSGLSRAASFAVGDGEVGVEQRNKDAISRLVMAGMRIHGLQPKKKTQHPQLNIDGIDPSERTTCDTTSDDEYKLVYHQTYKGAIFVFRHHIATNALYLQQDLIRETVENLLTLFCSDPLAEGFK